MNGALALWRSLPTWAKWTVGIAALLLVQAVHDAWGEHRFVAGLAESFLAIGLSLSVEFGGIAVAIVAGVWVARRTRKAWLGWIAGVATLLCLWWFLLPLIERIPGVGWRIREASHFVESDY